jgi:hypothetical protein
MCNRATRFSLCLLLAGSAISVQAQMPAARSYQRHASPAPVTGQVMLRPVPLEGSQQRVARRPASPQLDWNLQWRRSSRVAPSMRVRRVAANSPAQDVFAESDTAVDHGLQPAGRAPQLRPVAQSAWLTQQQPVDIFETPQELSLDEAQETVPNFFTDPFGDDPLAGEPPAQAMDKDPLFPPPGQAELDSAMPSDSPPQDQQNQLRSQFDQLNLPSGERVPPPTQPAEVEPQPPESSQQIERTDEGPTLGDMLRDNEPDDDLNQQRSRPTELAPSNQNQFENPFLERQQRVDAAADTDAGGRRRYEGENVPQAQGISCEELRTRIAEQTIDQVSLDISPPYRPDEIDIERYEKLKAEFDVEQMARQWTSVDGRQLATGRLRDLAYEQAVIQTEEGTIERLPLARLSEPDLAYISQSWGLPAECQVEQVAYVPRDWSKMTMTWKASNLCHNPLYFQDVNLERYGHTHGPFLEPVVQSAHFFGSIVVLPYKMGVHTPRECQYPLGYYRPGNCAPWITQPVPLSTRGALSQAATMTGLFWLIP